MCAKLIARRPNWESFAEFPVGSLALAASVSCSAWLGSPGMAWSLGMAIGVAVAFGHSLVSSQRGSELGDGIARACHWLLAGTLCGLGMVLAWAAGMALGVALGMAWHSARHWLGVPLNSATQPGLVYTLTHANSRWRLEARRRQPAAAWLLSPQAAASAAVWRSATPHRVARLSAWLVHSSRLGFRRGLA